MAADSHPLLPSFFFHCSLQANTKSLERLRFQRKFQRTYSCWKGNSKEPTHTEKEIQRNLLTLKRKFYINLCQNHELYVCMYVCCYHMHVMHVWYVFMHVCYVNLCVCVCVLCLYMCHVCAYVIHATPLATTKTREHQHEITPTFEQSIEDFKQVLGRDPVTAQHFLWIDVRQRQLQNVWKGSQHNLQVAKVLSRIFWFSYNSYEQEMHEKIKFSKK